MELRWVYLSVRGGLSWRITPLSLYAFPCHSPFQTIELPSFQSDRTVVPNIYCLMAAGLTSASQTFSAGASMLMEALAMRST
jgi:hypothetical protein